MAQLSLRTKDRHHTDMEESVVNLRLIDVEDLAKQIEAYLRGTTVTQLTSSTEQILEGK